MSPVIKLLITIDFLVFSGLGLVNPIFAVFIKEQLIGGSLASAGIAATVYLVVKAVLQIPIARFTDREPGNLREFWTLLLGQLLIGVVPFLYLLVHRVEELYAVQALYGLGAALAFPGFMAIFTKFGDHAKAAFSWSLHSTVVLLSMAASAAIGGLIGERYGFTVLFIAVGIFTSLGFFATLGLSLFYKELKLVNPGGLKPLWARLVDQMGRHRSPPIPPSPLASQLPK